MSTPRTSRVAAVVATAVLGTGLLGGCSLFGKDDTRAGGEKTSVFEVKVGNCVAAPTVPKAQVTEVEVVPCTQEHDLEAYATITYKPVDPDATDIDVFPGQSELDDFAQGVCAKEYEKYVGKPYALSDYFFTYLLPSARSWESPDRRYVLCFISTIGEPVDRSLKGARR